MEKKLTLKQRWRKVLTADNIVDLRCGHIFNCVLMCWSPTILIVMRVVRWLLNKSLTNTLKDLLKR